MRLNLFFTIWLGQQYRRKLMGLLSLFEKTQAVKQPMRQFCQNIWLLSPSGYWKQFFHRVIDRCMQQNSAVSARINSHGKDSQYVQLEPQKILAFLSWCSSIILSASFALLGSPPASIKALVFWAQSSISFISKLNFCNWYEAASFSFLPHKVQFSIIWHRII